MKKYLVKVEHSEIVKANDEDNALNQFWEVWEGSCATCNTEITIELNNSATIRELNSKESRIRIKRIKKQFEENEISETQRDDLIYAIEEGEY